MSLDAETLDALRFGPDSTVREIAEKLVRYSTPERRLYVRIELFAGQPVTSMCVEKEHEFVPAFLRRRAD